MVDRKKNCLRIAFLGATNAFIKKSSLCSLLWNSFVWNISFSVPLLKSALVRLASVYLCKVHNASTAGQKAGTSFTLVHRILMNMASNAEVGLQGLQCRWVRSVHAVLSFWQCNCCCCWSKIGPAVEHLSQLLTFLEREKPLNYKGWACRTCT